MLRNERDKKVVGLILCYISTSGCVKYWRRFSLTFCKIWQYFVVCKFEWLFYFFIDEFHFPKIWVKLVGIFFFFFLANKFFYILYAFWQTPCNFCNLKPFFDDNFCYNREIIRFFKHIPIVFLSFLTVINGRKNDK